jgi:Asp-tRNA(Asn)/Glu-tRNA(Gln) amidotransferase B subunit
VLKALLDEGGGGDPAVIAAREGFEAMGSSDLAAVVEEVIAANRAEWDRYAAGEDKLTGFFVGKIKASTAGKADLKAASQILRARRAGA